MIQRHILPHFRFIEFTFLSSYSCKDTLQRDLRRGPDEIVGKSTHEMMNVLCIWNRGRGCVEGPKDERYGSVIQSGASIL